jgi:hypothetical protein
MQNSLIPRFLASVIILLAAWTLSHTVLSPTAGASTASPVTITR